MKLAYHINHLKGTKPPEGNHDPAVAHTHAGANLLLVVVRPLPCQWGWPYQAYLRPQRDRERPAVTLLEIDPRLRTQRRGGNLSLYSCSLHVSGPGDGVESVDHLEGR